MTAAGINNKEAYLRKMVLDGYIVRLDISPVKEMTCLLSNSTNNLNQIARRANETRSVYESDIRDLQANYEKLWEQAAEILQALAAIKK
ncbi:MAG: plasmid mobilization relaxosome protein MobC [Clostridiales bacterium]|nr:plasmid mobilization relaxosome protein MobC [Clostridiales bacterium]